MPANREGDRHTAIATKACVHGQIVTENGFVGTAFKVEQIDRWTRPEDGADIAIGEEFEIMIGGVHEAKVTEGGMASAVEGDRIWIAPATNALDDASSAGALPVGVVDEVDASRNPDVCLINSEAWQAFLPGA